jgi:RNA polymerase-binding transcription factor
VHPVILELIAVDRVCYLIAKAGGRTALGPAPLTWLALHRPAAPVPPLARWPGRGQCDHERGVASRHGGSAYPHRDCCREATANVRRTGMDQDQARARLLAERAEVAELLGDAESDGRQARDSEAEVGDSGDSAQGLAAEGVDDAVAESMRDRLAALDRALKRLDDGTYGRSVRSGQPIPDERLEADPAAELTVEEARASS